MGPSEHRLLVAVVMTGAAGRVEAAPKTQRSRLQCQVLGYPSKRGINSEDRMPLGMEE